jgi:hypothetical protein
MVVGAVVAVNSTDRRDGRALVLAEAEQVSEEEKDDETLRGD